MNRRRMMMAQQSKPDLLEGYRLNNTSSTYNFTITWLDKNTIQLTHIKSGFMGTNQVSKNFIGSSAMASTDIVINGKAMLTLEVGKTYKLTLTVTEIIQNTATVDDYGELTLALGRYNVQANTVVTKFSELEVGTKLEVEREYVSTKDFIGGAAIKVSQSTLLWDIKFKVEFEEV